jgi:hypothetical protein
VAAVAVLVVAAVAGLRAGGVFSHAPQPGAAGLAGTALVTALTAGETLAFIAFIVVVALARPQRRPQKAGQPPRPRLPWWAKTLGVLASAFAVVAPLAILIARRTRHRPPAPFLVHPRVPHGAPGGPLAHQASSSWPVIAGLLIAVVIAVTVAVRTRSRRPPGRPARVAGLIESLAAGRAALEAGGTPREAIIACYAAMERGFAAAGSAPAAADTPAEVLSRATGAGIVRSANAEVLTGLFRRARYSTEPMTSAEAASAAGALAQMQAELHQEAAGP